MLQSAIYRGLYTVIFFITGIVIANILLPNEWGQLSLFIVNAAIIGLITGIGADGIIVHSLTNNKWNIREALYFVWRIAIVQAILFLLLEGGCLYFFDKTVLSLDGGTPLYLEVLYFVGLVLTERYTALFYSLNKAIVCNIFFLVQSAVYLLVVVFAKQMQNLSYLSVLYIVCLQTLFQGLLLTILFHLKVQPVSSQKIPWNLFFKALKLSLMVMATNFIQFIAYRIDFYFIKKFHSDYDVGVYAQANKFANLIWIVPGIVGFLMMPKFSKIKESDLPALFRILVAVNFFIVLIAIAFTNFFYAFFLHTSFAPGLTAFYLMLPGYFLFSLVLYLGAYFSWLGKFHYNLYGSLLCVLIILIADLLLIPANSFNGAAISNTIAYSTVFIFYLILLHKKFAFKFWKISLPKRREFFLLINQLK